MTKERLRQTIGVPTIYPVPEEIKFPGMGISRQLPTSLQIEHLRRSPSNEMRAALCKQTRLIEAPRK
jgi:hypothetical protein